jgi:hypothetical protein
MVGRSVGWLVWPASSLLALEVDSVLVLFDRFCQSRPTAFFTSRHKPFFTRGEKTFLRDSTQTTNENGRMPFGSKVGRGNPFTKGCKHTPRNGNPKSICLIGL